MDVRVLRWQAELQQRSYGYDVTQMETADLVEYVRWNVLALEDELHEALSEVSWKPWARSMYVNRVPLLGELIDAAHFLNNIWLAVAQLDPEESAALFVQMYWDKNKRNAQRQVDGYDGVSGKCPHCGRDLGDVELKKAVDVDGTSLEYCLCGFIVHGTTEKTDA